MIIGDRESSVGGSVDRVEHPDDPTEIFERHVTIFEQHVTIFEQHRGRLFGLAYRMLGQAQDAEDLVQDAYLRWAGAEHARIENPTAWLDRVLTNLCLNRLTSAAARREYIGPWLPEPVLTESADPAPWAGPEHSTDPEHSAEQQQAVEFASLVLLERLTPVERAVFVLRSAFGYGHRELAELLELSESASRQHYRRARQRLGGERRFDTDPVQHRRLLETFLEAAQRGELDGLERMLAEDVVSTADGGGAVTAARRPVLGRAKVAYYLGRGILRFAAGMELRILDLNGQPGLVAVADSSVVGAVLFDATDGLVQNVHLVAYPDKLRYLEHQLQERGLL